MLIYYFSAKEKKRIGNGGVFGARRSDFLLFVIFLFVLCAGVGKVRVPADENRFGIANRAALTGSRRGAAAFADISVSHIGPFGFFSNSPRSCSAWLQAEGGG